MTEQEAREKITAEVSRRIAAENGVPNISIAKDYLNQIAQEVVASMPAPWHQFRIMLELNKRRCGVGIKLHLPKEFQP